MKKIEILFCVFVMSLMTARADVLGTWTFNTGTTTAERLVSGNLASGVSNLSALVFNDTFDDFGPGVIPNSDNDGLGFGGNGGEQVAFVHRAASGISPTSFGGTVGTTISSAPIHFTVTAGDQPLEVDSLTVNITGGTAIFAVRSQVAGGLTGAVVNFASGSPATKTVYLPYAVLVDAGQTKTFTINLNSSVFNSAHYINEIQLNGTVGVAVATNTAIAADDLALTNTWDSGTSPTNSNVDTWVVNNGTVFWNEGDFFYGTMRFDEGSYLRNRNHTVGQPSVEFANVVFNGGDIIYADNTQIGLLVFDALAFEQDTAVRNVNIAGTRHGLRFGNRISADTPTRGIVTGSAIVTFSNYSPTDTFTPGIYDGDWSAFTGTLRVSSYNGATTLQIREWITDLSQADLVVDDLPNVKLQPKGTLTVKALKLGADALVAGTYNSTNDFTSVQLGFLDWTEGSSSITVLQSSPEAGYAIWALQNSLTEGVNDDLMDDAEAGGGDGMVNLVEYALGGDPLVDDAAAILPVSAVMEANGTNGLYYIQNRRTDDPSLSYTVLQGTDLLSDPPSVTNEPIGWSAEVDGFTTYTNRASTDSARKFLQLKVQKD